MEDLKHYRPIQHIIGYNDFCGCRIAVSPDVLIPRPETEEIVNWTISTINPHLSSLNILDLCTGSGCIAIALKKAFPQASVDAIDLLDKALVVAKSNAESNGTDIKLMQDNIIAPTISYQRSTYQLIISNPPYVREGEKASMQRNVLDYDPAMALFVSDEDPLRFYEAIARIATQSLAPQGLMVVEINESLADETSALLREHGFCSTVHDDFRGRPRWISAQLNTKQ